MRGVKFRGRRTHDKQWIYGNLVIDERGHSHIVEKKVIKPDGHHIRIDTDLPMFFDDETIGQYTGLKDKNGVKIYEGDKLEVVSSTIDGECNIWKTVIESILDFDIMKHLCCANELEVIGNIHERSDK